MWGASVVAAIALAAAAFMLRFLIALLSESAPSVCYWVVPVGGEPEGKEHLRVLRGIYFDDDCRATGCNRGDYYLEFLENENHGKEECTSGLIALDVRPASARLGWSSIHARRGNVLRERRF
jgi:hypothetical protein